MTALQSLLPPILVMVALTYSVGFSILTTRSADLIFNKKPAAFYEDSDTATWPVWLMRPTRQLANLFEFPVLFYALVAIAIAADLNDALLVALCWAYAGLRCVHAFSHLFYNKLWLRLPVFIVGNLIVAGMWVRLALEVLR